MIFHTNSILIDENGDIDNNVFGLVEPSVSALQLNQYRDQIQIQEIKDKRRMNIQEKLKIKNQLILNQSGKIKKVGESTNITSQEVNISTPLHYFGLNTSSKEPLDRQNLIIKNLK